MSKEITAPVANVAITNVHTITAQIITIKQAVGNILAMSYIKIGELLTQVKDMIPHSEWGYYLENEVEFSQRSANNYMKLYAEYSQNPNSQALANMPYAKAIQLLTLPEGDRAEFIETHDVEDMSSRELGKAIKERNAALQAQKDAEAKTAELTQSLDHAQQELESSRGQADARKKEIDKLSADLKAAEEKAAAAQKRVRELQEHPTVPPATIKKLSAEAAAKAKELCQKELDKANADKAVAEKEAEDLRNQLKSVQNASRVSSPEAAAFAVLVPQIESAFNQVNGCRLKIAGPDPELGEKMRKLLLEKLEKFRQALE